jgi:hypothetical protein
MTVAANMATLEQDRAAGGSERRKIKTRSGEVHVVSLSISGTGVKTPYGITMRFKSGGLTVSRTVGKVQGASRFELLQLGWAKVREDKIAEQNHWTWLVE